MLKKFLTKIKLYLNFNLNMTYYFSNKKVCEYMNYFFPYPSRVSLSLSKEEKLNFFSTNKKIKSIPEYTILRSLKGGANSNITYGKLGSKGVIIKRVYSENEQAFWNEVYLQVLASFYEISPVVIAAWSTENQNFIIMDYIQKKSKKIDEIQLDYVWSVLDQLKIIHMDFRPENLIQTQNKLYILDFGLSMKFDEKGTILEKFSNLGPYKDLYNPPLVGKKYFKYWDNLFFSGYNFLVYKIIYNPTNFENEDNILALFDFIKANRHVYQKFGIYPIYDSQLTIKKFEKTRT